MHSNRADGGRIPEDSGRIVGPGQHHVVVAKTTKLDQAVLTDLLGRQYGVISRAQAAACGVTPGALRLPQRTASAIARAAGA